MRKALILLALLLLPLQSWGQKAAADTTAEDEFPALQFLPPGTEVQGISIPRYENHRVSALLLSDKLTVKSRKTVILDKLNASLYNDDNTETNIKTDSVAYNFATKMARTTGDAEVTDPRFSARGKGVVFNTATRKGFLHGPVKTTIATAKLNKKKSSKK
jgi:lipopolysaccharide export system protein LptC